MSLHLKIGPAVIAVVADRPIHDRSYWRYGPFTHAGTQPPTVTIWVRTDPSPPRAGGAPVGELPGQWQVYAEGGGLRLELLEQIQFQPKQVARINRAFDRIDLHLVPSQDAPERWSSGWEISELLEPLLQWYLTARLAFNAEGVILHGSAVRVERGALVFSGPSGVGKTTLAGWWRDNAGATVLSDERIVAWRDDGDWRVAGTPWRGDLAEASAASAPLLRLFYLSQAAAHRFVRRSPTERLTQVLSQCFLPIWSAKAMEQLLAVAARLVADIPGGELQFAKDRSIVGYTQKLLGEPHEATRAGVA